MNSNIKYFLYLIGVFMIISTLFFGITNWMKSPFSDKSVIAFFEKEISTKDSSYSRIIKSMEKIKSGNNISVSFIGMNHDVSISYQAVENSEFENGYEEKELKKTNEIELEGIKSISNYLTISYIGKKHFLDSYYCEFYNTTANHSGYEKETLLIYFPDKLTLDNYIKSSGIDTYTNSKTKTKWITELDSNWILVSQPRNN